MLDSSIRGCADESGARRDQIDAMLCNKDFPHMSISHRRELNRHFNDWRAPFEVLISELNLVIPMIFRPHDALLHHGIVPLELLRFRLGFLAKLGQKIPWRS